MSSGGSKPPDGPFPRCRLRAIETSCDDASRGRVPAGVLRARSIDIGGAEHVRQQARRRRHQGMARDARPGVRGQAPSSFRRAVLADRDRRRDRRGRPALRPQVRPREPRAVDRNPGRDRDLRDCRQPDVEGGQQARSGARVRPRQVLLPEPARRDHHGDRVPAAHRPDLHEQGHGSEEQEDRRRRRCRRRDRRNADRGELQPAVGRAIHAGHEQVRRPDQSRISQTTDCSPEVAAQAQDIAGIEYRGRGDEVAAHPAGQDVVYWIAPENGAEVCGAASSHICEGASAAPDRQSRLRDRSLRRNASPHNKQIGMEQKQCGFTGAK